MEQFLFVEKYRPKTIEDCILPEGLKQTFRKMVSDKKMQNLLLCGSAGCGKTTVAKALCHDLDMDWIMLNCSENGNIDTLRTHIRQFASCVSFDGKRKCIILDEFDYSNANSFQPALRGFMEEFADNCSFILTCNYKNRIIDPLHSRCSVIDFVFTEEDKLAMSAEFYDVVENILTKENVPFDSKVLVKAIRSMVPDFRRCLNEIQRYSTSGEINAGFLTSIGDMKFDPLFKMMKDKKFEDIRKWIGSHKDNDQNTILSLLYKKMYSKLTESSVPIAILILAEYMYKGSFMADSEINLMACMIQLSQECQFK
jgi:DNA polymerase III delta prime subunit